MSQIDFGDDDPEDAWDANDPVQTKLKLMGRIVEDIEREGHTDRFDSRRNDALRLCADGFSKAVRASDEAVELQVLGFIRRLQVS